MGLRRTPKAVLGLRPGTEPGGTNTPSSLCKVGGRIGYEPKPDAMDVRRRRSEPQPAEGAEGPDHGSQEGADSKAREGDGRRLMAIEDAADAARKGEAKEDAQTGARLKDFPKGEAKEDAQLGVRTAARTGEAKEDAQTGARPKDFPGEATEDAQKGVDEGASRTTEAPRTGGSVVPNGGEGVGGGETPGRSFFTPTARGGKVTETPKEVAVMGPRGKPQSFGPLFTPEQAAKMDALRAQAPLLDTARARRECEEAARPKFLEDAQSIPGVEKFLEEAQSIPRVEEMKSYERELDRMHGFMDDVKLRMAEQQEEKTLLQKMLFETGENEAHWRSENAELRRVVEDLRRLRPPEDERRLRPPTEGRRPTPPPGVDVEDRWMKTPCPPHEIAIHTPPSPPEDPFATPEEPRSEEVKTGGRDGGAGGGIKDEERERCP